MIGYLVSSLKFPIIFITRLYGIIGEMDIWVLEVVQIVIFRRCSQVPFRIPKELCNPSNTGHHHIRSDVKFASLEEKQVFDVLLNDKSLILIFFQGELLLYFG